MDENGPPKDKKEPATQRGGARAPRQREGHVPEPQEVWEAEEPSKASVQ